MLSRLFFTTAAMTLVGCYQANAYDEIQRYFQRKDTVTFSAGDAKEVNARTHMLTPWPRGVHDRRIPANGSRMAKAVECYESGPHRQQQSDQSGTGGGGGFNINFTNVAGGGGQGGGAAAQGTGQQNCN